MIRVLLVHDDASAMEQLRESLSAAADVVIVDQVTDADRAVAALRLQSIDIIVIALDLPAAIQNGTASAQLRAGVPLMVLAPPPDAAQAGHLYNGQAVGYLCIDAAAANLAIAVRTVYAGNACACPQLASVHRHSRPEGQTTDSRLSRLTKRELELLRHIAGGAPNREIARTLGLSRKTVSTHRLHILAKLGLHSNVELARVAFEHGLLEE